MHRHEPFQALKCLLTLPLGWLRTLTRAGGSKYHVSLGTGTTRASAEHRGPERADTESSVAGSTTEPTAESPRHEEALSSEVNSDRAQGGGVYAFISFSDSEGISLFSIAADDGSRAVILFDDPLAAEAFVFLEELGEGWRVVEHGSSETATLLDACSLADVDYVALDPPSSAISVGWNLRLVRIADFAASLRTAREKRV